ncbi:MAG: class I SAM-dependent methyltransferase [Anaerolineaceae bacterium]|nr:MAG: class I SAM-dependent methyltransferase [Anaerolineaceae bacterium]
MLIEDERNYMKIIEHYERCLERYGDSHLGVDWPNKRDVATRYRVMLDVIRERGTNKIRLLDFGCGASHLYEYVLRHKLSHIMYSGLDISRDFIDLSRSKFPSVPFYCLDVLDSEVQLPEFDYVVMNGVFTEKRSLERDEMMNYFERLVGKVFALASRGITFNVMSSHVDWEREDLFHLPLDALAAFLTQNISRHFVIRNDYGLYEYTVYVYGRP